VKHDSDIWLGDLLQAFHSLSPGDESTRATLARMAGFAWSPRLEKPAPPKPPAPVSLEMEKEPPTDIRPPTPPSQPSPPETLDGQEQDLPFIRVANPEDTSTEWQRILPLETYQAGQGRIPPPYQPVFRPEWSRTLSTTLAATELPIGPVDEERLVVAAASGHPITVIPRRLQWSLALGMQLLLDVGPAMEPFMTDLLQLSMLFRECVGPDHVQEARFIDCPGRGILKGITMEAYQPPDAGVPVVVVSDIGIGGPAMHVNRSRTDEWLDLARLLGARGSALLVLVPYPEEQFPGELHGGPVLVEWDRSTTAGTVRRLLKNNRSK